MALSVSQVFIENMEVIDAESNVSSDFDDSDADPDFKSSEQSSGEDENLEVSLEVKIYYFA